MKTLTTTFSCQLGVLQLSGCFQCLGKLTHCNLNFWKRDFKNKV